MFVDPPILDLEKAQFVMVFSLNSVHNRSGIIARHDVSNAKPLILDLILRLPETNFWLKTNTKTEVKSSLNEIMEVYLATVTYFMCDLLFENGYFVKF